MDGWMDGWVGGWMDGWVDGLMDGWVDGWMDGWMDGWIDGWMGGEQKKGGRDSLLAGNECHDHRSIKGRPDAPRRMGPGLRPSSS
jgi:hypothetical protein